MSCHPTECSVVASVVHHSMGMGIATDADLFLSSGFAVCLYAHLSPNLHAPGALKFVHP